MTEIFDNIRKLYQFHTPATELAPYIEFFSESSAKATYRQVANNPFSVRMFPSWTPTCYINLGEPYQLHAGTNSYSIGKDTNVLILRNNIVERRNLPTDHIFTIKFSPGGLEAILGINQVALTNQVAELETILPATLIHQVKKAGSFPERVSLLEQFFLSQYRRQKADYYNKFIADTISVYQSSGMTLSTAQLADRLFLTSKTINRYFHRVVGTAPKNYLATFRARAALSAYVTDSQAFFPDNYGYYDMSHFYKEVINFTGQKLIALKA